jgi:hypothetical protein
MTFAAVLDRHLAANTRRDRDGRAAHLPDNGRAAHLPDNGRAAHPADNGRAAHPADNGRAAHPADNGRAAPLHDHVLRVIVDGTAPAGREQVTGAR